MNPKIKKLLKVLVLLIGAPALFCLGLYGYGRWRLDRAMQEYKAAGGRINGAEIEVEMPPEHLNAAPIYNRIAEYLEAMGDELYDLRDGSNLSELGILRCADDVSEVSKLFERHTSLMELIGTAASRPYAVWDESLIRPYPYGEPTLYETRQSILFGDYRGRYFLVEMLLSHACVLARSNRREETAEALRHAAAIRGHNRLLSDPNSFHLGQDEKYVEIFAEIYANRDVPRELAEVFVERDPIMEIREGRISEWAEHHFLWDYYVDQRRILEELGPETALYDRVYFSQVLHGWPVLERALFVEAQAKVLIEINHAEKLTDLLALKDQYTPWIPANEWLFHYSPGNKVSYRAQSYTCLVTKRMMAREAVKLREYKAEYGEYPQTWESPEIPIPPAGRHLVYRRTDEGFELSVPYGSDFGHYYCTELRFEWN